MDPATGFVLDFFKLQEAWAPLHDQLDHRLLNDVKELQWPTTEGLAFCIWRKIAMILYTPSVPNSGDLLVSRVMVKEGSTSRCEFVPESNQHWVIRNLLAKKE